MAWSRTDLDRWRAAASPQRQVGARSEDQALAAVAVLVWLVSALVLLLAGQAAASWLDGNGWVFPSQANAHGVAGPFRGIGGLLTGTPGEGMDPAHAAGLPPAPVIYLVIVVLELAWLAALIAGAVALRSATAPTSVPGFGNPRQLRRGLGIATLDSQAAMLRPDLHPDLLPQTPPSPAALSPTPPPAVHVTAEPWR